MNVKNARRQIQAFRMGADAARLVLGTILHKASELAGEVDSLLSAFELPPEEEEPRHPTSPCPPHMPDFHVNGEAPPR